MDGLDIPVDRLFALITEICSLPPPLQGCTKNAGTLFSGSPLILSCNGDDMNVVNWGGAAFITAYWRALYFGHVDPDTIHLPYEEAKERFGLTSKTVHGKRCTGSLPKPHATVRRWAFGKKKV